MTTSKDAYELLRLMRIDATAIQAKITDLTNILNELHLEDKPRPACPHCGITFRHKATLAEHIYVSHDGPEPQHWIEAETLIDQTPTLGRS